MQVNKQTSSTRIIVTLYGNYTMIAVTAKHEFAKENRDKYC